MGLKCEEDACVLVQGSACSPDQRAPVAAPVCRVYKDLSPEVLLPFPLHVESVVCLDQVPRFLVAKLCAYAQNCVWPEAVCWNWD